MSGSHRIVDGRGSAGVRRITPEEVGLLLRRLMAISSWLMVIALVQTGCLVWLVIQSVTS